MLKQKNYMSFEGGKYWEGTYTMGGFDDGMSNRFGDELFKDYHLLLAMAGGDGLKFARETQKPLYDFIDSLNNQPFSFGMRQCCPTRLSIHPRTC